MEVRQSTNKLEGQYVPTVLQKAIGEPLRSEQRTGELLPRVLSRVDLLAIFIAIVLFIPNASVVQATQGAGSVTYLYWVLGTITFLIPGAIVAGQLNRFMPADGAIYVWTHRALGPLWGFFAAFCAWFPGVLVLLSAGASITDRGHWNADCWCQCKLACRPLATGSGCSQCATGGRLVIDAAFATTNEDSEGSGSTLWIGYFRGRPGGNSLAAAWTRS